MDTLRFGPYEALGSLAEGGMSEIFLGRDTRNDRKVVIKRLLPQLERRKEFKQMFMSELNLAMDLGHPNIVQALDTYESPSPAVVFELVEGPSLVRILPLTTLDKLPIRVVVWLGLRVARALAYAHERMDRDGRPLNIVHRDISPANILVSNSGEVKVIDFGIATNSKRDYKTQTGILKGKLSYMSPEQILAQPLDGRSDVFSLGIVLWELVTGTRLFKGLSDLVVMQRIVHEPVMPPSIVRPGVSRPLDDLMAKALAKDPKERFSSARAMAEALERLLALEAGSHNPQLELAEWIRVHAEVLGPAPMVPYEGELTRDLHPPSTDSRPTSAPTRVDISAGLVQVGAFHFDWRGLPLFKVRVEGTVNYAVDVPGALAQFSSAIERGKRYAILYDLRAYNHLRFPDAKSREELRQFVASTKEASARLCIGIAIIVKSKLVETMINFIIGGAGGSFPSRVFSQEADAKLWLREQLEKEPNFGIPAATLLDLEASDPTASVA